MSICFKFIQFKHFIHINSFNLYWFQIILSTAISIIYDGKYLNPFIKQRRHTGFAQVKELKLDFAPAIRKRLIFVTIPSESSTSTLLFVDSASKISTLQRFFPNYHDCTAPNNVMQCDNRTFARFNHSSNEHNSIEIYKLYRFIKKYIQNIRILTYCLLNQSFKFILLWTANEICLFGICITHTLYYFRIFDESTSH